MPVPEGIDPNSVMHPDGTFWRNPTHLHAAERAKDQSEIIKQLVNSGRGKKHETFLYEKDQEVVQYPGMKKIREMMSGEDAEEKLAGFFKMLLRSKPNIYMARISLGDYPSMKQVFDRKISNVGSSAPKYHTEIAEDMAIAFADSRLNIVDFVFSVRSTEPGTFLSEAEAWGGVSDKELNNDEYFNPVIEIEYWSN